MPVGGADFERLLLSKVIRTGDIVNASLAVRAHYFHDPVNLEVYEYLTEFWAAHATCPSADMVRMEFGTSWQMDKSPDPLGAYIDLVIEKHKDHTVRALITQAGAAYEAEEVDEAMGIMSGGIIDLAKDVVRTSDEEVVQTLDDQTKEWERLAEDPGALVGIPTGFPFIDSVTGGMQPEQFVVLIGPEKSGKSSVALAVAIAASDAGNSVMFMSYEMSNLEQKARYAGLRAGFNPNKLLQGTASPKEFAALRSAAKLTKNNREIWFIHDMGARSLSSMIAKVHQYHPDLLIIDGIYLMDAEIPDVQGMDTRALTKISRAAKVLAQTMKIPVLATTQALGWKIGKGGLQAQSAGYTSAFGQDCDVMLGVQANPEADGEASLRLITGRNVGRADAVIRFDWNRGLIQEMPQWNGEDEES